MFEAEMIREKTEERRELQRMYSHACHRAWEIRTKALPADREPVRRKILAWYNLEKKLLNDRINDLGDEIWKAQKEMESDG